MPSEKWLDQTRNKIQSGINYIENDLNNDNFIVDNTDIKPESRKIRDTSNIENEQKHFNEILKSEDESYNPFGESRILSRKIFDSRPKPKKTFVPTEQPVEFLNTEGSGDDDGSTTEREYTQLAPLRTSKLMQRKLLVVGRTHSNRTF